MLNHWHFNVGNLVQLEANGKIYEVIWRGTQRLRDGTGWVRYDVYKLNAG
jgi:hypothetical protein